MAIYVGLDIGGTFTDLVAYDTKSKEFTYAKYPTTPKNLIEGVLNVIKKAGLKPESINLLIHGTTVVINTIIERKGAKVGLITTKGFRDVIEIGRHNRPDMYNLFYKKPEPIVPRKLRFEVEERIMADGTVLKPLSEVSLEKVVEAIKREGIESIAVSLLHSYANPTHEVLIYKMVKEKLPKVHISLSHEITREYYEYERTITTVLNAYVMPKTAKYIEDLEKAGFKGKLFLLHSSGGVVSAGEAKRVPVKIVESGPVAGVVGANILGNKLGYKDVITFDMGGTTAKSALIVDGESKFSTRYYLGGYERGWPLLIPTVDIIEVGAGGGSIAWVDEGGALRVGPLSAGAEPGPACYGKGGKQPTITDANLTLGRLNPNYFLGGEMKLYTNLAVESIKGVAKKLSLSVEEAALGIVRIANTLMSNMMRNITIERGYDPREFTIVAFGGAGPTHALALARELGVKRVVIPVNPAHFSAWGMVFSNLRYDYVRTYVKRLDEIDTDHVEEMYGEMLNDGVERLKRIGIERYTFIRYMDLRYLGQEHTLTVPVPSNNIDVNYVRKRFDKEHEKTYAHSAPEEPVELVNIRMTILGLLIEKMELLKVKQGSREPPAEAKREVRKVIFEDEGALEVPIFIRENMLANNVVEGPAIIEEEASTTVLYPGDVAVVDEYGNIVVEVGGEGS